MIKNRATYTGCAISFYAVFHIFLLPLHFVIWRNIYENFKNCDYSVLYVRI